ncbi:MAG: hypothetical protein LRY66_12235 [Saccharospirillaceae bacterium]|nr:hypothetical protein [Saccharospirillaceae bacterium]MCD8532085.1 hypothetical protein [Saccharospirillaceae bacterium]
MRLSFPSLTGAPAPRLSVRQNAAELRRELAASFRTLSSVETAWQLGARADTPGTAFFCGYQAAMRQIDPALAADAWAAFCISEAGLRSLRQMQTRFDVQTSCLSGEKSHVMLAGNGLDWLYVVAASDDDLLCVQVAANAPGVEVLSARGIQPFLPDVPHTPVRFNTVNITSGYRCDQAHQRLNKPFRYWEDVHVALAFSGWLLANQSAEYDAFEPSLNGDNHGNDGAVMPALMNAADHLAQCFYAQPQQYSLVALDALEALLVCQDAMLPRLTADARAVWQRDRILLQLATAVRGKIRSALTTARDRD